VRTSGIRLSWQGCVVVAMVAFAVAFALVARLRADDDKREVDRKSERIAKSLIGTWALRNVTLDKEKEIEPPARGGRLKFYTGKHWAVTQADSDGVVTFHYGGSYTVDGEECTEIIKYAAKDTEDLIGGPGEGVRDLVGKRFKFSVTIEGDRCALVGIGNPYTETWSRAK
jgi:hypothetical protein